MAKPGLLNVLSTQTFDIWLNRTNELVDIFKTDTLTASPGVGDTTVGNATLDGIFNCNSLNALDIDISNSISANTVTASSAIINGQLSVETVTISGVVNSPNSNIGTLNVSVSLTAPLATISTSLVSQGIFTANTVILQNQATTVDHPVRADRGIIPGDGLSGGGNLTEDRTLSVDSTVVRNTRLISVGDGLDGGGDLSANRTISLEPISSGSGAIGALSYNGTTRLSGRLYGGTTNPSSSSRLNYDGNLFVNNLTTIGDVNSASDASLKKDIAQITQALEVINRLVGVSFSWNESGKKSYGLIAQDVEKIIPEAVETTEDGIKTVSYMKIIPFLIESVNTISERIEKLE